MMMIKTDVKPGNLLQCHFNAMGLFNGTKSRTQFISKLRPTKFSLTTNRHVSRV